MADSQLATAFRRFMRHSLEPSSGGPESTAAATRRRARSTALLAVLSALLTACFWTAPAVADGLSEGRFLIERIVVEGVERAAPELIVAESLIEPGTEVSESELRDAVYRIERLPFVLAAEFSLRRGSERGRYELVVTVQELRRFVFGENLVVTRFTNSVSFNTLFAEDWTISPGGLVGMRFFAGDSDVFFVSAAAARGLQAGWSHYGLFGGRRGVLDVGIESRSGGPVEVYPLGLDPTFSSWRSDSGGEALQVGFGLPLSARTGLRLDARVSRDDGGERRNLLGDSRRARATLGYSDLERAQLELAWSYDSTDDPVFPGEGLEVDVAIDWQELDADLFLLPPRFLSPDVRPGEDLDVDVAVGEPLPHYASDQVRLAASLAQHWRLAPRLSTSLSLRLAVGVGSVQNVPTLRETEAVSSVTLDLVSGDLDLFEGECSVRASLDLWGPRLTRTRGDLRFELGATFGYDRTSPQFDLPENPLYRKTISASLVFRNSWGLFRFSLQVADYGRGL
ncbi:MAG: hypothetical protein AAGC60_08475 [Acidobacteriota bacterium]